jgi:4-hydroxy-4-methyl-2-oxoglutarate aldolase
MVHAAIERIVPGDVVVITMPQPHAIAVVGDLLATQIARRGAAAVLTPAAVRDLDALRDLGLPVWSQFVRAKSCEKKTPGALDVSLTFGGTTIHPGDAIVLDDDGACAVAASDVAALIERAREKTEREDRLRAAIARGELTLDLNDLRRLLPGGPPVGGD